jgi:hypothetical protein
MLAMASREETLGRKNATSGPNEVNPNSRGGQMQPRISLLQIDLESNFTRQINTLIGQVSSLDSKFESRFKDFESKFKDFESTFGKKFETLKTDLKHHENRLLLSRN